MRPLRSSVAALTLLVVVGACGGGDGSAGTTTASTSAPPSTAATSTTAVSSSTAPATTPSTLAADAHPEFGIGWESVWPTADMTATYLVTTFEGDQLELPATMEYGVAFAGGTYDRLVVGGAEPGFDGMVVYFDRSDPWQVTIVGEEVFRADDAGGPESVYVFEVPVTFDGFAPIGETRTTPGRLALTMGSDVFDFGVTYDVTLRGVEAVTVEAGEFPNVLVVDVGVGGELMGGDFVFPLEIWLDAANLFVKYTGASGFDVLELSVPWA